MSPNGQNASRDGLVKIGWVVYSVLFFVYSALVQQLVNAFFHSYAALLIRCKVL